MGFTFYPQTRKSMITQMSITGEEKLNMRQVDVARRFLKDWEDQLQSIDYAEAQMKSWFIDWLLLHYGSDIKQLILWMNEGRGVIRYLQEEASKLRP